MSTCSPIGPTREQRGEPDHFLSSVAWKNVLESVGEGEEKKETSASSNEQPVDNLDWLGPKKRGEKGIN